MIVVAEVVDEDGFQLPKKSRRCSTKNYKPKNGGATMPYLVVPKPTHKPRVDKNVQIPHRSEFEKLTYKIGLYKKKLRELSFYQTSLSTLKQRPKFHQIYSLGIGSMTTNTISLIQFAYILAIYEDLHIEEQMIFFDPFFTSMDIELITSLSYEVDIENKSGKYSIDQSTLFFMPHCGVRLYSNVLWANWNEHLKDITYIGNSLSFYEYISSIKNRPQDQTNTIDLLFHFFTEVHFDLNDVKKDFEVFSAFNQTSIHYMTDEQYNNLVESNLLLSKPPESFEEGEISSKLSEALEAYKQKIENKL